MAYALTLADVKAITELQKTFGTTHLLPKMSELPAEFADLNADTPYHDAASSLFFKGTMPPGKWTINKDFQEDGVSDALMKCIGAHLKSWEPKHEHKMAGVAYMISLMLTYHPEKK